MPLSQEDYDKYIQQLQGFQNNHWNASLMPKTGSMTDMLQAIPLALMGMGGPKMPAGAMKSGPDAILPPRTAQSPDWNIPTGTELFNKIRNSGLEAPANTNLTNMQLYSDAYWKQQFKPHKLRDATKEYAGKEATTEHPAMKDLPLDFYKMPQTPFEANNPTNSNFLGGMYDSPLFKAYMNNLFKHANKNE